MAPQAARNRTGLRSLLLSPPHPRPEECDDFWRSSDGKTPGSLGSLLGGFLPRRFREFLSQLGAEWIEQPQPPTSPEPPHQKGVSECWQGHSPPSPDCSFLPDLQDQSLNCQNNLKKSLLDQIPTLQPLRRDQEQFTRVKKANKPQGPQAPKLKAEHTHSSLEEDSGHHRRCCPFRVRFADETVWDTAFRYWERSRALQQDVTENRPATPAAAATLEQTFGSIGRWVESLPKALDSQAKEEAKASSPCSWDSPSLPIPELEDHLSEDTSALPYSSLPYIPRATTQRQQRDRKTFLGAHSILDQVDKSPSSWSQKLESFLPRLELHTILNRGRPKGYQLLLPSVMRQESQQ